MAIVFGVYDVNSTRRERAIAKAESQLGDKPTLCARRFSSGNLTVATASSATTPYSSAFDRPGENHLSSAGNSANNSVISAAAAIVLGDFESPAPGLDTLGAKRVLDQPGDLAGANGYYLAAHVDGDGTLTLGVDFMSLFPLYYWEHQGALLFGTSPELFRTFEGFEARLSTNGVLAALMFSHPVDKLSVYEGVFRLKAGEGLKFCTEHGLSLQGAPRLVARVSESTPSYASVVTQVDTYFDAYFRSIAEHPSIDFFVSGGQDSRFLAGYLSELANQGSTRAVTVGKKSDNELAFACKMVSRIGWRHRIQDTGLEDCAAYARELLTYESMGGTFVNPAHKTARDIFSESGAPFLSGYFGDAILGDRQAQLTWDDTCSAYTGDKLLANMRKFGFEHSQLSELLSCSALDERIDRLSNLLLTQWQEAGSEDWQRSWRFSLDNRVRHHVGQIIWRLSLGSWPLLAFTDVPLLKLMATLPQSYLRDRIIQSDLIKQRFPKLARLPLDNNGRKPIYLLKPASVRFLDALPSPSSFHWRIREWLRSRDQATEKRFYYRVYDYNSSAWKGIRNLAATALDSPLEPPLNQVAVGDVLGQPDLDIVFEDGIIDSAKYKTLVGLTVLASADREVDVSEEDTTPRSFDTHSVGYSAPSTVLDAKE
ncbi:MAG: asparagine synthase-related protein [Congregibacter sp.]